MCALCVHVTNCHFRNTQKASDLQHVAFPNRPPFRTRTSPSTPVSTTLHCICIIHSATSFFASGMARRGQPRRLEHGWIDLPDVHTAFFCALFVSDGRGHSNYHHFMLVLAFYPACQPIPHASLCVQACPQCLPLCVAFGASGGTRCTCLMSWTCARTCRWW